MLLAGACIMVGTVLGILIGMGLPGEKWQEVDANSVSLGFEAAADGERGILLTLRF